MRVSGDRDLGQVRAGRCHGMAFGAGRRRLGHRSHAGRKGVFLFSEMAGHEREDTDVPMGTGDDVQIVDDVMVTKRSPIDMKGAGSSSDKVVT